MLGHHSISEYPISSIKVLSSGITLTIEVGSFTFTGRDVNTNIGRKVVADKGTFTLSGQAVNTNAARKIIADKGTFILTGKAVTLTYVSNTPNEIGSDSGNSHTKLLKRIKSQNELILQLVKAYYD